MKKPLDLQLMVEPDQVATQISEYYQQWKSAGQPLQCPSSCLITASGVVP